MPDTVQRSLQPVLNPGVYVFATLPASVDARALDALAFMREPEGVTVVLEERTALQLGLPIRLRAAWITLTAPTELTEVGLTARFARQLAEAGIACNVIAAVHHDHVFVPFEQAQTALDALIALERA